MQHTFYFVSVLILACLTVLAGAVCGVLVPYLATVGGNNYRWMEKLGTSFGGGTFMGLALFHLLPESNSLSYVLPSTGAVVPMHFLLAFGGFVLLLFTDKILISSNAVEHVVLQDHLFAPIIHSDAEETLAKSAANTYVPPAKQPSTHHHAPICSTFSTKQSTPLLRTSTAPAATDTLPSTNEEDVEKDHVLAKVEEQSVNITIDPQKEQDWKDVKKVCHKSHHGHDDQPVKKAVTYNLGRFEEESFEECDTCIAQCAAVDDAEDRIKGLMSGKFRMAVALQATTQQQKRRMSESCTFPEDIGASIESISEEAISDKDADYFTSVRLLAPFTMVCALAIHSLFDGIVIGVAASRMRQVTLITLAISFHKFFAGVALSSNFTSHKVTLNEAMWYLLVFCISSPVGCILGFYTSKLFGESSNAIANSISSGSMIYIATIEIVAQEFAVGHYKSAKFTAFVLGALIIALLTIIVPV